MDPEDMDMADHLIAATRLANRGGLTKDQYINAASTFWDTWHQIRKVMRDKPTNQHRGESDEC